jgi:hypothetical protein
VGSEEEEEEEEERTLMTNDPSVGNSAKISLIAFKISAQNTNLY